nr:hypothetical protein [Tanacetum cinerariifolium]
MKRLYKVGLSARVESSDEESLEQAKEIVADKDLIDDITLAKALMEIKVTAAGTRPNAKSIMKMKDQIGFDEQEARRLQAEIDEQDRFAEEKAQQIQDENLAWDNVQAMIDTDYELAARLQEKEQGELTIEEKSRLFVELMDKRKKHFVKLKAKEQRRKPLTKAQKRNQMLEDDKESEELKRCLEIIPDDEYYVTIDSIPLSIKTQIIDYKIYKEGKNSYFQIFKADKNSQMYLTFSKMLKNFNREDLKVLWRLVKDRFIKTKPVDDMDSFLLHTLKTMFEHHIEDTVWKSQQGLTKVKSWKHFYSCAVHCVTMQNILYYLLIEKMYPLTNHTLHQMFNNVKLQVDVECKMAYELLRLVKKQLKEGYKAQ